MSFWAEEFWTDSFWAPEFWAEITEVFEGRMVLRFDSRATTVIELNSYI